MGIRKSFPNSRFPRSAGGVYSGGLGMEKSIPANGKTLEVKRILPMSIVYIKKNFLSKRNLL